MLPGFDCCSGLLVLIGVTEDGRPLSALEPAMAQHAMREGRRFEVRTRGGFVLVGAPLRVVERDGRLLAASLGHYELRSHTGGVARRGDSVALVLGARVLAVEAGAPEGHEPATVPSALCVPRPRSFDAAARELIGLYERARSAFRSLGGGELEAACAAVVERLDAAYPDEWLLRFNLLESLTKAGEGALLGEALEADLERLELRFGGREPIATGLSYVRSLVGRGEGRPSA
jgi:hypothetical protein